MIKIEKGGVCRLRTKSVKSRTKNYESDRLRTKESF